MAQPYSINILLPDGDPEGIKVIRQMNWTGLAIAFPRARWDHARLRQEFTKPGVYILVGEVGDEDSPPTIYVGEADGALDRIDRHIKTKDFWSRGIAFFSSNDLHKTQVQWLEHALVTKARDIGRCILNNSNIPQAPTMPESELADCEGFVREVLKILPLAGLQVFVPVKAVAQPATPAASAQVQPTPVATAVDLAEPDTIIVPAKEEGFQRVFLGEDQWWAVRIGGGMIPKIKWIAAYQSAPVSAITHLAPVSRIEPFGDGGKYRLVFSAPATPIGPIPLGAAPQGAMQGPRYTRKSQLSQVSSVAELLFRDRGD